METLSPEHIRSRLKELAQTLDDAVDSSEDSKSEPKRVLENCNHDLVKDFRSNLEISGISRRRTGKGRRLVEFARRGRLGRNPKHQGIDGDTQPGTDSEELAQTLDDVVDSTEDSMYELKRILEDYRHNLLVVAEDLDVVALQSANLEAYIEQVKGELNSVEEANIKASSEIDALEERISYDLAKLDHDCEALSCLLDITDSKGMLSTQSGIQCEKLSLRSFLGSPMHSFEDHKFKDMLLRRRLKYVDSKAIYGLEQSPRAWFAKFCNVVNEVLELNHQVERMRCNLTTLEERQHILKRLETIGTLGNVLYGVKCIQCDDNYIKLSLRTPIPSVDFLTFPKELGFSLKSSVLEHELAIEVADKTTELKSVEIFPSDVHLDGIMDRAKSSRLLLIPKVESPLGWLIRQIQQSIILCTVRRLLVEDACKCRCPFVYSDAHEMITANLAGDLHISLKLSEGWPLLNSPLILMALKYSDNNPKSVSSSFLYKVKEQANCLDIQTRQDLRLFVDAIEQLVKELLPQQ